MLVAPLILGAGVSLCLTFAPTIFAFMRGNMNTFQLMIWQVLVTAGLLAAEMAVIFIPFLSAFAPVCTALCGICAVAAWIYFVIKAISDGDVPF